MFRKRSFIKAVLIITITLFCIATPLFGKGKRERSGSVSLRKISQTEFIFVSLHDPLLYPETSYNVNPAVLNTMNKKVLITDAGFFFDKAEDTVTRIDDSVGVKGGTYTNIDRSIQPDLYVLGMGPSKKKGKSAYRGLALQAGTALTRDQDRYTDYNSYSEQFTRSVDDFSLGTGLNYFYSRKRKRMTLGLNLGYGFGYAPEMFRWVSDESLAPASVYIQDTVRANREYTHSADVVLGSIFPLSRAAELGLSLVYQGSLTDASQMFTGIDSDGDGHDDTVMAYKDYVVYTGEGGPDILANSYDARDLTLSSRVTLHPALRMFLTSRVELFISGSYSLFDLDYRRYYSHLVLTNDIVDDASVDIRMYNAGFTSFEVMPGLAVRTGKKGLLKIGAGFIQQNSRFSQEGISPEGISRYSRLNPDNLTELELGLEPVNNALVDEGIPPSKQLDRTLRLSLAWEFIDTGGVSVFLEGDVTGSRNRTVYKAYNLDTRSVWFEEENSDSITWRINPVAGIAFQFGKNGVCTLKTEGTGTLGSVQSNTETAPFDESIERTSLNGSMDVVSSSPAVFNVQAGFMFSY